MVNKNFNDQVNQSAEGEAKEHATPTRYFKPGELMELDPKTVRELTKMCREGVDSWQSSAGTRQSNLRRWNDLLEGVMEETDFPWEGASTLHIPLIALHIVTLHSVMARSILDVDPIWYGKTLDKQIREIVPDIEEAMNYKAKAELNVVGAVRDWIWNTCRDGLGWIQLVWAEESHPIETVIRVRSVEEFQAQYPTPEEAQLSPEAYAEVITEIQTKATSEVPHEVPIFQNHIDYRGPKADAVDEADMVRAPYTSKDLKGCRVFGKRFYPRLQELKERAENGELWTDAVKSFSAKNAKTRGSVGADDAWRSSREEIEGIKSEDGAFSDEVEAYELCVRYKGKEDKRETLITCTYSHEKRMLLGAVKYPYTFNCYIPARIIRRPGRMAGIAVPERLEDINTEVDASIRHEINSDTIELSPIFKGKKGKNDTFDPEAEENLVRPGVWWLFDEPKEFEQMKIQASDKSASMERRQELMRYAEMLIGPTQLLSGKESPTDPNAPARKTIALIAQSNMRIEDYMREFRGDPDSGVDGLGNGIMALYEQFGDDQIEFENREGDVGVLDRSVLSSQKRPKMSMRGVTAVMNPDTEFEKALQWYTLLRQDPEIAGDPVKVRTLLSDLLIAGRNPSKDALLPDKQEVVEARNAMFMQEATKQFLQKVIGKAKGDPALLARLIELGIIPPPPPPPVPGAVSPVPGNGSPPLPPALPVMNPSLNGAMGGAPVA